jgi:hypothetical protein
MIKKLSITFVALVAIQILFQSNAFASGFNAGRIIDDSVFADTTTMTIGQIQDFLNTKLSSCDTNGQQNSEFGGPDLNGDGRVQRWEWGKANYNQTTFPCLRDYTVSDGRTAAQVIYDTAQKYTINPQVFIVLLQKEQGLVTDTWPLNIQYRSATGYGCPDTAPCDSQYYGLVNQLDWSGKMFRAILDDSPTWYTPYELGDNYIQYNPVSSCGGSVVNVQTRATQALYNYTPYQPNQATLDAGWGTAPCGAYGNLRFHQYFTGWFGDTYAKFISLDNQRWMRLKVDASKVDPFNSQTYESFPAGTDLHFVDKILFNNKWYLRTQYDSDNNLIKGIPLDSVGNITSVALENPRYMELSDSRRKWNPVTGEIQGNPVFPAGLKIKFARKIQVSGKWYYQSEYDSYNGTELYISANATRSVTFEGFEQPRYMRLLDASVFVDPSTGFEDTTRVTKGTQYKFTSKVSLGGKTFFRNDSDTNANISRGILSDLVEEVPYSPLDGGSKWMLTSQDALRVRPATGYTYTNSQIPAATQVLISENIVVNNQLYYRTLYDATLGNDRAIQSQLLSEIPYVSLDSPRIFTAKKRAYAVNPKTNQPTSTIIEAGSSAMYTTKIYVQGQWFLRNEQDSINAIDRAVPLSVL